MFCWNVKTEYDGINRITLIYTNESYFKVSDQEEIRARCIVCVVFKQNLNITYIITSLHVLPWTTKPVMSHTGDICSNSQQYNVWVKIIDFFYAKNH